MQRTPEDEYFWLVFWKPLDIVAFGISYTAFDPLSRTAA